MNIERYRWTEEEEEEIFRQLALRLKPAEAKPVELTPIDQTITEAIAKMTEGTVGLSTGYRNLDRLTRGLDKGELITVAGHTSHGKSQLAQNIAYRVAEAGSPVLIVSLEDPKARVTARLMKIGTEEAVTKLPIFYPKKADVKAEGVEGLVSAAVEQGVGLVIIDHLHYFSRSIENATSEIGKLVREFKRVAITFDVPIILISHITKLKDSSVPGLEHLRDSSFIAQDSDIVLMVYRDREADDDQMIVKLLKNRNRGIPPKPTETLKVEEYVRLVEPLAF